jgi:hypothetical protein
MLLIMEEDITNHWTKLRNDRHNLHASPRMVRMVEQCGETGRGGAIFKRGKDEKYIKR